MIDFIKTVTVLVWLHHWFLLSDHFVWLLSQNLAVFERNSDSSTSGEESSEESSDNENSDTHDTDVDSVLSEEHKNSSIQQSTHSHQLPRIKMPKSSNKRRVRPRIEVVQEPDNTNVPEVSSDQLHWIVIVLVRSWWIIMCHWLVWTFVTCSL